MMSLRRLLVYRGPRSARAPRERGAGDAGHRECADRGARTSVERHDRTGSLHPYLVLDRTTDAKSEVELGLHDLAGLADLLAVRDPARIDCSASGANRSI